MDQNNEQLVIETAKRYLSSEFPKLTHELLESRKLDENLGFGNASLELTFQMLHTKEDAKEMLESCESEDERDELKRFLDDQPKLRVIASADAVLETHWLGISLS